MAGFERKSSRERKYINNTNALDGALQRDFIHGAGGYTHTTTGTYEFVDLYFSLPTRRLSGHDGIVFAFFKTAHTVGATLFKAAISDAGLYRPG